MRKWLYGDAGRGTPKNSRRHIGVCISWLWDGGVDLRLVKSGGDFENETQIRTMDEILPWLEAAIAKHFPKAGYKRGYQTANGKLQVELQKSTTRRSTSKSRGSATGRSR
jgi:hypothetical protein